MVCLWRTFFWGSSPGSRMRSWVLISRVDLSTCRGYMMSTVLYLNDFESLVFDPGTNVDHNVTLAFNKTFKIAILMLWHMTTPSAIMRLNCNDKFSVNMYLSLTDNTTVSFDVLLSGVTWMHLEYYIKLLINLFRSQPWWYDIWRHLRQ